MKFIVDAQLPPGLCRWLRERGHEAEHVGAPPGKPPTDRWIADQAERDSAVLISKDDDFVGLRLPDRFPFLWLRCGNVSNRALSEWLRERWPEIEQRLTAGERMIELNQGPTTDAPG